MELLKQLCEVPAPSGNEVALKNFIAAYVREHQTQWRSLPTLIEGKDLRDSLILAFGKPRIAVLAHMDTVGFTVRYHDQLIPIGSPKTDDGYRLVGADHLGPVECELAVYESKKVQQLRYQFGRALARGTELTFACDFRGNYRFRADLLPGQPPGSVQRAAAGRDSWKTAYWCLPAAKNRGGGSVPYLVRFIYEEFKVTQY